MGNYFEELASVDVAAKIEKKGNFSYLSWAHAVKELLTKHPDATWTVRDFDGSPYKATPAGCFVAVTVRVGEVERTQWHPVLDDGNKSIKEPNAFQVNRSIQRALTKAIALHGLGLSLYIGEDVPGDGEKVRKAAPLNGDKKPAEVKARECWKKLGGIEHDFGSFVSEHGVKLAYGAIAKAFETGITVEQALRELQNA